MQIQPTLQLFTRIFCMKKTILGQRQSRRRNGAHVRVTDQRQDGMVERRSRDFDSSLLHRCGMRGQHFSHQCTLSANHECLILEREPTTLFDECGDVWLVEEEFIKPCDLGEHLQVREILCLKIFVGSLGGVTGGVKSLP